jgi:arylsulfatase A-like enzyme
MHRIPTALIALCSALIVFPSIPSRAAAPATRPNVVLIVADDLGYGDLGCYGCPDIPTPHIDSIARAGVRFTQAYAYPTCSPTRAAMLTGRYAEHFGISAALMGDDAPKIERATTVAQLLHDDGGYATGLVGKWHLGYSDAVSPTRKGFDEFFGFRGGKIDFYKHTDTAQKLKDHPEGRHDLWEGDKPVRREGYTTNLFTDRAKQFIRDHAAASIAGEKPFFLYLAHNAPHYAKPGLWQAPPAYLKRFNAEGMTKGRDVYRAMVACLDDGVGEVLGELSKQKLDDRTLVIFMSDNGPDKPGSAKPLSGGKFTFREGGVRVPWVARWPGVVPANTTRDDALHVIDVLPTLLAATSTKPRHDLKLDGVNAWPAFTGGPPVGADRTIYFSDRGVRRGRYKLLNDKLFDIDADPQESTDVAKAHPAVHKGLAHELREWVKRMDIKPATRPATKPAAESVESK